MVGTHRDPFLGIAATHKPVKVHGMVLDRIVAGKMNESRILVNAFI